MKRNNTKQVVAVNRILRLSQDEIAAHVGVSPGAVSGWMAGRSRPRKENLRRLDALVIAQTRSLQADPEERLRQVVARLELMYGSPRLGNKTNPLDELFFILLSLKTTYNTYEDVYRALRARFFPWRKLLNAAPDEVEGVIKRGGLGSIKARAFIDIAKRLRADFGKVSLAPLRAMTTEDAEAYLCSLPGVGKKTARCVLMYSFDRDVVPVDTHTYRVGVRLDLIPPSRSPNEAHRSFDSLTPKGLAYAVHTNFVAFGREICLDAKPRCSECPFLRSCPSAREDREKPINERRPPRKKPSGNGRPVAVDIYAGCGGLSAGIEEAGFRVAYALDSDPHACRTHEKNFPRTHVARADVREVEGSDVRRAVRSPIDLVAGGPNCQGVSERGLRSPDDPRNFMFPEFVRIVSELRPRAFVMENVPGLAHRHNFDLLRTIFDSFQSLGYVCGGDVLLAADYGVPQLRHRFFLIGLRDGGKVSFPTATHSAPATCALFGTPHVTVGQAIMDLPEIDATRQAGAPMTYPQKCDSEFARYAREGSDVVHNHVCSGTEDINLRRISCVPEGGNWKDIPPELLPARFFRCRMTDHSTTYARLRRDQPAFTITALYGNVTSGAFTHPTADRALSVREGARLQSFRDRFIFEGPRNSQYRQIGNAVPPLLGRAVAAHTLALLNGHKVDAVEPRVTPEVLAGERAWDALPVLTPRFKALFGSGTRWPKGWGLQPDRMEDLVGADYRLRSNHIPVCAAATAKKAVAV